MTQAASPTLTPMLGVIPVRDGVVPAGGAETVAECGGRALLAGSGLDVAAAELAGVAAEVELVELGAYAPGRWAAELADLLEDAALVVLPASPDGRDLAPRLAHELGRPLLAGAVQVTAERVQLARRGGLDLLELHVPGPAVITLQPGVRGVEPSSLDGASAAERVRRAHAAPSPRPSAGPDATVVDVLPPDVATMDLSEATRIVGGGAGLDSAERFRQLHAVAEALGASVGATRVITDRGWIGHERQIGTTGVVVDPRLYVALGISGAVQHTAGLGAPDHIISVNTDPHCPMMQLADLAIVSDANAVLDELARRLGVEGAVTETAHV